VSPVVSSLAFDKIYEVSSQRFQKDFGADEKFDPKVMRRCLVLQKHFTCG
jgi:hypothetical protein